MKYYSTKKSAPIVGSREAILAGLAPDGGLYMPEAIPKLDAEFLAGYSDLSFVDIAFETSRHYFADDIDLDVLRKLLEDAYDFDLPLIKITEDTYSFELFHGPTLAFKDFAARFMARIMGYFIQESGERLTILVATSGDTGGAVGHGFLGVEGIDVVILYPSGMVSPIQEQQLTTMGHNVHAIEVNGSFDDCQNLVKQAFVDQELQAKRKLGSANSINIARLIPQTFYYVYLASRLRKFNKPHIISVPSGNFGNLTAGLIAREMGAHLDQFVAATNVNDSVPRYLKSKAFNPLPSLMTISNAMDVGNPSNFIRMDSLFDFTVANYTGVLEAHAFTDSETREAMKQVYDKYGYVMDPHGAVGWLGLQMARVNNPDSIGVFVETAHPAKFKETVDETLGINLEIPERLAQYMDREKDTYLLANKYSDLKEHLLKNI